MLIIHRFVFHPLFRLPAALVGVRDSSSRLEVLGDQLRVDFGPWKIRTDLANVVAAEVTGPYAWPKVIGPPHLSLSDRGMTCGTNPHEGVCITFRSAVKGLDPFGIVRHPSITVTVDEPAALAELLDRSSHDEDRVHLSATDPDAEDLLEAAHDELTALTARELRLRARRRGIGRTSAMTKPELIDALSVPTPEDGVPYDLEG